MQVHVIHVYKILALILCVIILCVCLCVCVCMLLLMSAVALSLNVLLQAGIHVAESMVVLAPTGKVVELEAEILFDAGHIAAMHKIARLFPRLRMTAEIVYRFNIRFLYTTVYERLTLQSLRRLVSFEQCSGCSVPWKPPLTTRSFFTRPRFERATT